MKNIPRSISNTVDLKQLARSSGSVIANYIEADEAVSKKDFIYRIKICRKEAKESKKHLQLMSISDRTGKDQRDIFVREYEELVRIFSAIINKAKQNP